MTPEQIAFLEEQRVARLATVDEHGRPHVLPVCFALHAGRIYTPIDEKPKQGDPSSLRRVRNVLAHPQVCLVADIYDDDWSQLAWLQVRGHAALVDDIEERVHAHKALRDRYVPYRSMDLESRPLIGIVPIRVVAWSAGAPTPDPSPTA